MDNPEDPPIRMGGNKNYIFHSMINQVERKNKIIVVFVILILSLNCFIDVSLISVVQEKVDDERDSWRLTVKEDMNVAPIGTYGEYTIEVIIREHPSLGLPQREIIVAGKTTLDNFKD